jgi:hypothetical protein
MAEEKLAVTIPIAGLLKSQYQLTEDLFDDSLLL